MTAMVVRARDLNIISPEQEAKLYKQLHYRKWRNPEPFDLKTKITLPVSFRQPLELLIDENILQGHEIPLKIADDNPVRVIDALIDSLDMEKLGFTYATPKKTGRNPYNFKNFYYLKYLFEQLPNTRLDNSHALDHLLPWSETLPVEYNNPLKTKE